VFLGWVRKVHDFLYNPLPLGKFPLSPRAILADVRRATHSWVLAHASLTALLLHPLARVLAAPSFVEMLLPRASSSNITPFLPNRSPAPTLASAAALAQTVAAAAGCGRGLPRLFRMVVAQLLLFVTLSRNSTFIFFTLTLHRSTPLSAYPHWMLKLLRLVARCMAYAQQRLRALQASSESPNGSAGIPGLFASVAWWYPWRWQLPPILALTCYLCRGYFVRRAQRVITYR